MACVARDNPTTINTNITISNVGNIIPFSEAFSGENFPFCRVGVVIFFT
jgi:hypothetical protein